MICITYNVRGGKALPLTPDELARARAMATPESSARLREITETMAWVDKASAQYKALDEEKKALKMARPALIPHAASFDGFERKSEKAHPSGLVMFDIDHYKGSLLEFFETKVKPNIDVWRIALVERSASDDGMHIFFEKPLGMTIQQAQKWMAKQLEVVYDEGTFDLARCCFIVPQDYVLFENIEALTTEKEIPEHEQHFYFEKSDKAEAPVTTADVAGEATAFGLKAFDLCLKEAGLSQSEIDIPGERNWHNTLKALLSVGLCQLMEKEQLLAVVKVRMPNYYETEDCRRLVADFYKNYCDPNGRMTLTLRNIYSQALKASDGVQAQASLSSLNQDQVYALPQLPRLLQLLVKAYPEQYRPAVLISSLVFLGTLLTRLRSYYLDGAVHSPSFIGCIIAPQAAGKSFTRKIYDLLTAPIKVADAMARQVERDYLEKKKAAKNTRQQPEDPKVKIRLIPATASNAMILKRSDYSQGEHLCTFAEEIDTLTKGQRAGAWSEKSDIYRMAFDNAEWGQDYMSDNSYSGVVQVFYNILVCGTPNAKDRFFKDVEDGLVSRVMFAELPDMLGAKMPRFGKFSNKELAEINHLVEGLYNLKGDTDDGLIWVKCRKLSDAIDNWVEEHRLEYLQNQDNPALDIFRRRSAVMGYRAGMVMYALCGMKYDKMVVDFALWVANFVLHNQLNLFGERMNQVMNKEEERKDVRQIRTYSSRNIRLLDSLSSSFTERDVSLLRQSMGFSGRVDYIINRWLNNGLIYRNDTDGFDKAT